MNKYQESLISMMVFLVVCLVSFMNSDFSLFGIASESMREILGTPPPAHLISITLMVYLFSSMVLTISDMVYDKEPKSKWTHLGYRTAFFLFYGFGGMIAVNFIPVMVVGLFLYGLDQLHILHYEKHVVGQVI